MQDSHEISPRSPFPSWLRIIFSAQPVFEPTENGIRQRPFPGIFSRETFFPWSQFSEVRLQVCKSARAMEYYLVLKSASTNPALKIDLTMAGATRIVEKILSFPKVDFENWLKGMESRSPGDFLIWKAQSRD